jgi:DNA processing protein
MASGIQENSADITLWLKLIRAEGVGPKTFVRLLKQFGTVERVMGASIHELTKVKGIGNRTAESIARTRDNFNSDKELELASKLGVWLLTLDDKRYPPALKSIYDPPPVLYVKGDFKRSDSLAAAIVGSRRCSNYGMEQSSRFSHFLSGAGFTVVSGMARGIDTAAHRGAISAGGRTIAVQGCGLKNIFPPENQKLFQSISENGACISELPLEYEPLSENFPARNRIIAGLSIGIIVIEAALRSGALLTAKAALAYDREVMAVPGRIDSPMAKGANQLIKDGARLIDSVEDVMEAIGVVGQGLSEYAGNAVKKAEKDVEMPLFDMSRLNLTDAEKGVYECLEAQPLHIEELIAVSGVAVGKVNASLISLRLKGLIKDLPGNMYKKN